MLLKKNWLAALLLSALALFLTLPVRAVEKGKISTTAEVVCAFRSFAALDPDPKTRNPDYMAKDFVSPDITDILPGLGQRFDSAKIAVDTQDTGVFYYVNARTHHMDKLLEQALDDGASQVVILGAGFDSRAYRFHEGYPEVRFFEIDLPTTSQDKQNRVEKILGKKPGWVSYVAINFNNQTLDEVLTKAGFDKTQKTFYLWEGVTYFISPTGVDNTLSFVAEHSAAGSQLVFDYMLEDVVQGTDYSAYGARKTVFWVAMQGEPYVFGIVPDDLKGYVNQHGLKLLTDLGPQQLSRRYLIGSQGLPIGRIAGFLRIAQVKVVQPAERKQLIAQAEASAKRSKNVLAKAQKVAIPEEVQQLLESQVHCFKTKNLQALQDNYADSYFQDGHGKADLITFVERIFRSNNFAHYDIVLTRFDRKGDRAKIDGFVDRQDYRMPLIVQHIVREVDGKWRWIGNQR